jgi:putative endonuclease
MRPAWVYIMTNRPNGILYTGVTTNLIGRVWQHREGTFAGFTEKYGLTRLVYFEEHAAVLDAIQREKNIKHWKRAWKARLILEFNPFWADLYDSLR